MSYSRSDFADDVINSLIDVGALDAASFAAGDLEAESRHAISALCALKREPLAARFANEILNGILVGLQHKSENLYVSNPVAPRCLGRVRHRLPRERAFDNRSSEIHRAAQGRCT
ncbi:MULTISPECIES: hypothetical protein [unclassified Caballeronia]|uniref:hypothetical protein n=1 Tax=unclassified Caballeronia TaxID=2646786 RepID=UPI0020279A35|nr:MULTISPECIES: hypothetical protein [unclassified Caballeronia]